MYRDVYSKDQVLWIHSNLPSQTVSKIFPWELSVLIIRCTHTEPHADTHRIQKLTLH